MRRDFDDLVLRLVRVARGLGFVVLTYFIPAVTRDLLGLTLPGGTLVDAFRGGPPWIPLGILGFALALSALFVRLYSRTEPAADEPRPLLRLDRPWLADWGRGFAIGGAAASLAMLPMILSGHAVILGVSRTIAAAPLAALGLLAILCLESMLEEFGFRGPAQRDLGRATRPAVGAIFLAGSFALIHGVNPEVGRLGVTGVFLAGMALAGLVRWRGDLGMACGAHCGWNVLVGQVWSTPISGFSLEPRLLEVALLGSPAWTGGGFGVEGSVPGVVLLALLAAVAWRQPPGA